MMVSSSVLLVTGADVSRASSDQAVVARAAFGVWDRTLSSYMAHRLIPGAGMDAR
jgi:hypothetical protein